MTEEKGAEQKSKKEIIEEKRRKELEKEQDLMIKNDGDSVCVS